MLQETSIQQLQEYSKGCIVELPPFSPEQPFVARLKRPSIMAMVKLGKIPNALLSSAGELFDSKQGSKTFGADDHMLSQMYDMLEAICESAFVSPTYQEIKNAGIELTDEQKTFVFQYVQAGVKALDNFRQK